MVQGEMPRCRLSGLAVADTATWHDYIFLHCKKAKAMRATDAEIREVAAVAEMRTLSTTPGNARQD